MRVEYNLELNTEINVEDHKGVSVQLNLEGAEVYLTIDDDTFLKNIKIVFSGLPIQWERDDLIHPYYPQTKISAYKIFSYVSNRILIQTALDAFDIQSVLNMDVEATPETEKEIESYKKSRKRCFSSLTACYTIIGSANLTDYDDKYQYSEAFSNYADGLKTNNLVTKYEQFYKIIEAFFNETGSSLDQMVSDYVCQFDSTFTPDHIESLRLLRNRCIHPQHRHGHITSENIELLEEITRKVEKLKKLASLLLENPPN